MIDRIAAPSRPVLLGFAAAASIVLMGCSKGDEAAARLTPAGEEREVAGTVTEAKLTSCSPVPGKAGTCEGTLVVQPADANGTAVSVEVTRDVVLKKGDQTVFLPQLRGAPVAVRYRATKEGPNLATSVISQ